MRSVCPGRVFRFVGILCLSLLPSRQQAAEFVEISLEIETLGYRLQDTESSTQAKPRVTSVVCIAGTNEWRIESSYPGLKSAQSDAWCFDGTNIYQRLCSSSAPLDQGSTTLSRK